MLLKYEIQPAKGPVLALARTAFRWSEEVTTAHAGSNCCTTASSIRVSFSLLRKSGSSTGARAGRFKTKLLLGPGNLAVEQHFIVRPHASSSERPVQRLRR